MKRPRRYETLVDSAFGPLEKLKTSEIRILAREIIRHRGSAPTWAMADFWNACLAALEDALLARWSKTLDRLMKKHGDEGGYRKFQEMVTVVTGAPPGR